MEGEGGRGRWDRKGEKEEERFKLKQHRKAIKKKKRISVWDALCGFSLKRTPS